MIKRLSSFALIAALGLSLSACGDDDKAKTETPAKTVEKAQPAPSVTKESKDMTPTEAVDNMKRDAGIVADKAKEGFNAAKDAVTKALADK